MNGTECFAAIERGDVEALRRGVERTPGLLLEKDHPGHAAERPAACGGLHAAVCTGRLEVAPPIGRGGHWPSAGGGGTAHAGSFVCSLTGGGPPGPRAVSDPAGAGQQPGLVPGRRRRHALTLL